MKKILFRVFEVVKICLNLLMCALFFIKIDRDVVLLPNNEGGLKKVNYYYSVYDKLCDKNLQFLIYIAIAAILVSIVISIVACTTKDNRKLRVASHIIFAISAIIFLVLLILALQYLKISY